MVYGYVRISTKLQDEEKQKFEILNYAHTKGFKLDFISKEQVSGRISYQDRQLGILINKTNKGDTIIVTELSRFGRSLMEVMEILNQLMKRDVKVYVCKNNMEIGENMQSKILAFAFSLSAEIERELISSRTKEALAKVKADGKTLGRPKGSLSKSKLDGKENQIEHYFSKKISIASMAKLLDVAPSTFYSYCKNRNIDLKRYKVNSK